ncbi:hypothetical protein HOY82DRAFT_492046 [Tuber indicum]|nr:hypothetical protein HOY82DRAFT_492046 [Tuber indicum]
MGLWFFFNNLWVIIAILGVARTIDTGTASRARVLYSARVGSYGERGYLFQLVSLPTVTVLAGEGIGLR